jgi:hypothetical protein
MLVPSSSAVWGGDCDRCGEYSDTLAGVEYSVETGFDVPDASGKYVPETEKVVEMLCPACRARHAA